MPKKKKEIGVNKSEEIVILGEVLVDSGRIMIQDPCHRDTTAEKPLTFKTGFGDGLYPVSAIKRRGRGIVSVTTHLDPTEARTL